MATFPTPSQGGPQFSKYRKRVKDWGSNTIFSTYEDQSQDVNTSSDDVPQFWDLEYGPLSEAQADTLIDFWNTHKRSVEFVFIEPRKFPSDGTAGSTFNNARFESFDYDHKNVRNNSVRLTIRSDPA